MCKTDGPEFDDLPMEFQADFYRVNWRTRDFDLTSGDEYRIQIFLGTFVLASRDVLPRRRMGRGSSSCSAVNVAFCEFRNGSTLPIKVRIESFAGCIAAGGFNPDDPEAECITASLDGGDSFQAGFIAKVETEDDSEPATFNFETCADLRNRTARPLITDGLVDIPTFGDCVEITTLDGEDVLVAGTATLCEAFAEATGAGGLTLIQAARMTVHRFGSKEVEAGVGATALPHSEEEAGCEPVPVAAVLAPGGGSLALNRLERLGRLARNTWQAVNDQVRAWIEPAPLWARTAAVCNRGGCSSRTDFRSSFQAALPAWMNRLGTGHVDGDFGEVLVGTELTATVRVQDSGEFHVEVGEAPEPVPATVDNVRLTVTVNDEAPQVRFTGDPAEDWLPGTVEVTFTVEPGSNTVKFEGIGVGIAEIEDDDDPVNNVFAPSFLDTAPGDEVELDVGTLEFKAEGFEYFIEQDGDVQGVVPLEGPLDVVTFYHYGNPNDASANTQIALGDDDALETEDTSIIFLYKQTSTGIVSLVIIHDKALDNEGGLATFVFGADNAGMTVLVNDDGSETAKGTSTWKWAPCCTDGGAFGGLFNGDFTLTIDATFPLGGLGIPGQIGAWDFLTGELTNPTRKHLTIGSQLTISDAP